MLLAFHYTINIHQVLKFLTCMCIGTKVNGQLCIQIQVRKQMGLMWHSLDGGPQALCTAASVKSRYIHTVHFVSAHS